MLPKGHAHKLVAVSKSTLPDGTVVIHSRCQAEPPTPQNQVPVCSLEEERRFRDEVCTKVRYRFGGLWFDPLDLLRVLPIAVQECEECEGYEMLAPCERCGGLGVVGEDGLALNMPDLRVRV